MSSASSAVLPAVDVTLSTVIAGLKEQSQKLTAAQVKFEKDQKAAADTITQYMKKVTDPTNVDVNKKLEDFKIAAKAFRESGTGMTNAAKEIALKIGEHAKEAETIASKAPETAASNSAASSDTSPKAPPSPRGQTAVDSNDAARKASEKSLQEALEKISELEKKEISTAAAHQEEAVKHKSQIEAMTYAYNQYVDKLHATEESYEAKVAELKENLKASEVKVKELQVSLDALKVSESKLVSDRDGLRRDKAELIQRLSYADRSRDNEFKAFEHAVREHEREIHQWQTKYADALGSTERLRLEKQALEARVADEHLREHIRVLQKENNALREDRIKAIHESAKEPVALSHLTQVLQENIAALERENKFLNERNKLLHDEVGEREKHVSDALQKVVDEKRKAQSAAEAFERQIRLLEFDRVMNAVQTTSATTAPQQERSCQSPPVETWDKASQVADIGRRELEREVLGLRAELSDLEEQRVRDEEDRNRLRSDLEDRLIQQMKASELQISDFQKEVKIRSFKLTKLQGTLDSVKQQLAHTQAALAAARAAPPATDDSKLKALEKRIVALQLENEDVASRNKMLKREMVQRQDEADQKVRVSHDRTVFRAVGETKLEALAGGVNDSGDLGNTPSPNSSALRNRRISEMESIDAGLLELHKTSIALDAEASRITIDFEASQKACEDRVSYLESSVVFWRSPKSVGQQGPNGESRTAMLNTTQKELAAKQQELRASNDGIQKAFLNIARQREQILRETTSLMKRRAELE